jgi:hypothetical protein
VKEWHSLNHHGAITTGKDAAPEREDELGDNATGILALYSVSAAWTYETKNIETPNDPKSWKTGLAGNLRVSFLSEGNGLYSQNHSVADTIEYIEE